MKVRFFHYKDPDRLEWEQYELNEFLETVNVVTVTQSECYVNSTKQWHFTIAVYYNVKENTDAV